MLIQVSVRDLSSAKILLIQERSLIVAAKFMLINIASVRDLSWISNVTTRNHAHSSIGAWHLLNKQLWKCDLSSAFWDGLRAKVLHASTFSHVALKWPMLCKMFILLQNVMFIGAWPLYSLSLWVCLCNQGHQQDVQLAHDLAQTSLCNRYFM